MQRSRQELFGISIDAMRMPEAVEHLLGMVQRDTTECRYVVTPNVDHAVMLQSHWGLQDAYRHAELVLADGHPLIWASRFLQRQLPERVAGSDLVPALFDAVPDGMSLRVFLLGAAPGVAQRAAERIESQWTRVHVVGVDSPPQGFEYDPDEGRRICQKIAAVRPDIVILGLGAPKQECWIAEHRRMVDAKVAICAGATIDFLAGEKKRAPRWMQRSGLEWLHRMACEPRRLVRRYAKDAWIFPQLLWRQYRMQRSG
jgi:N-acetylglucosaminyldiphosphoundecaprenol N-acetyl-beta-D-mannosaminyltransferase